MQNDNRYEQYGLIRNPFPVAGIAIESIDVPPFPKSVIDKFESVVKKIESSRGDKALAVIGQYGSGKTTFMHHIVEKSFIGKNYATFYFGDPGIRFYDLANQLLRQIGRYNFARALWEMSKTSKKIFKNSTLVPLDFDQYLRSIYPAKRKSSDIKRNKELEIGRLSTFFKEEAKLTKDEEISRKLAQLVIETGEKPFFDYFQFREVKDLLVAVKKESDYFAALITAIMKMYETRGVVFLIDEIENIAVNKNIGPARASEYFISLRNLLDTSVEVNFWVVIAMTPESKDAINGLIPPLWERVTNKGDYEIRLTIGSEEDAIKILSYWLKKDRMGKMPDDNELFPFSPNLSGFFKRIEVSNLTPRVLVRIFFFALEEAIEKNKKPPIENEFLIEIFEKYYNERLEKKE